MSGGLTSESKIMNVHHGPKVIFNVTSLKAFNEDLNPPGIFAYAHDEIGKLSGRSLLDTANGLSGVLKRHHLDQGCANCGLRAKCGPRPEIVRPAKDCVF